MKTPEELSIDYENNKKKKTIRKFKSKYIKSNFKYLGKKKN
jgi:hypothetical protein